MKEIKFTDTGDFIALAKAKAWLKNHDYSCGSMCNRMPIGILKGDWTIAKWRNLTAIERNQLDGQITSQDFRNGPVVIHLKNAPTEEEIKTGNRVQQCEVLPESVVQSLMEVS